MKGIILAGGKGTRLYPTTKVISKQLLPVYDKPLIYYPLSVLMLAGIREVLVISTPHDIEGYQKLLSDGAGIGMNISYAVQDAPKGIAEAFIIGEKFIGSDDVCLILGDNVFYGQSFSQSLKNAAADLKPGGAVVFGYPVSDPKEFGVVEFDNDGNVVSIEEKPQNPKSRYAVPGLYFYSNEVIEIAKNVKPSSRGELEITAVNNAFLEKGSLKVSLLGRGLAWLDTGSPDGMLKASMFVEAVQSRQGYYISCIEEIAYRRGFIDLKQLEKLGREYHMTDYGKYLLNIVNEERQR